LHPLGEHPPEVPQLPHPILYIYFSLIEP
jgi:hypothetical protein